jgi:hypothetical protein
VSLCVKYYHSANKLFIKCFHHNTQYIECSGNCVVNPESLEMKNFTAQYLQLRDANFFCML